MSLSEMFAAAGSATLIDLTHPLRADVPVWPGHPHFCQCIGQSLDRGDVSSWHTLSLGEHTGTHVDAPSHFIRGGLTVEQVDSARFFGRLLTLSCTDITPDSCVELERFEAWEQCHGPIRPGDAIAFHFGWDRFWDTDPAAFLKNWPGLSGEVASKLATHGVRLVASDCLSVDHFGSSAFPAHRALLGAGVLVGENFAHLGHLPPVCRLTVMPLPIVNGSGSPVRAIAVLEE